MVATRERIKQRRENGRGERKETKRGVQGTNDAHKPPHLSRYSPATQQPPHDDQSRDGDNSTSTNPNSPPTPLLCSKSTQRACHRLLDVVEEGGAGAPPEREVFRGPARWPTTGDPDLRVEDFSATGAFEEVEAAVLLRGGAEGLLEADARPAEDATLAPGMEWGRPEALELPVPAPEGDDEEVVVDDDDAPASRALCDRRSIPCALRSARVILRSFSSRSSHWSFSYRVKIEVHISLEYCVKTTSRVAFHFRFTPMYSFSCSSRQSLGYRASPRS